MAKNVISNAAAKNLRAVYLSVSWLNIENVSLGGGPREGEARYSIAKGEGCLTIGQTHHIYRHLEKEMNEGDQGVHCP